MTRNFFQKNKINGFHLLVLIIVLVNLFDYINGFHGCRSIANIVANQSFNPFQAVSCMHSLIPMAHWV
jgi:hypothetical protein